MNATLDFEEICEARPAALRMRDGGPADLVARRRAESPIRVLHVAQSVAGGVASFFEEIAAYQSRVCGDGNVSYLIPAGSEPHLPGIDPARLIAFAATTRRPDDLLKFGQAARHAIRRMNPDIVHLHSSFAGAVVRAFLPGSSKDPALIYSPHGWSFSMETFKAAKLAYAAIERRLAARTELILVNSASEYELAVRYGLPERKMKLVTHGISWAPGPQRRGASGPMRIAFVGRHDRQKGLDILLDAIGRFRLRHIHFHIVGERVVDRSADRRAPARKNVTFHGWLSRAETSALIQQMDAVVMPSRWEAFGLVAIEAMRAGVAVIASNRGALPEVVRDGIGGRIFDIDDPDALGRLLERLDVDGLQRLGESARHLWEREYVADRMNRLTCEAYESVLAVGASLESIPSPAATHRTVPQPL